MKAYRQPLSRAAVISVVLLLALSLTAQEPEKVVDPSGGWANNVGVLSLLQHGNALAFSYSAVFGATAHLCDGAGVAGLVSDRRWEYTDDEGTVAFTVTDEGVEISVVDGVASFCGAGWSGDQFSREGFSGLERCTVTAERAYFYEVKAVAPERRRAYVISGDTVETAPVRHDDNDDMIMARYTGSGSTTIGLLHEADISCIHQGSAWK